MLCNFSSYIWCVYKEPACLFGVAILHHTHILIILCAMKGNKLNQTKQNKIKQNKTKLLLQSYRNIKGVVHPDSKLAYFVCYLKFLKQIVQGIQNLHWNFSKPSNF